MSLGRYITTALFVPLFAIGSAEVATSSAAGSPPEPTGRPILDQFNTEVLSSTINGGSSAYEWQQGVTVGVAGQLTRIALYAEISAIYGDTAPTQVSVTLGAPWQSDVPTWTTTKILRQGWNMFDLSKAKILVAVGAEFAIGIHGQRANNFNPGFAISYGDEYPGGDLFLNGSTAESEGNDLLFKTYVSPKRVQH
jgi:hypothetical protein